MKGRTIISLLSLFLSILTLLILSSCGDGKKTEQTANKTQIDEETETAGISMEGYVLICPDSMDASFKNTVGSVGKALGNMPVSTVGTGSDKEIRLSIADDIDGEKEHKWSLEIGEKSVEIKGSDSNALLMGLKKFMKLTDGEKIYAAPGDKQSGSFGDEVRIFENLVTFTLAGETLIDKPAGATSKAVLKYPTIIELCHQSDEKKNGILLASGERWLDDHDAPIYKSLDGGATFNTITFVRDTLHGNRSAFAPCLFELPRAVGDMPAGTVILGTNCINAASDENYIVLFRSFNCGNTWEAFYTIAGGKKSEGKYGIWEPNFVVTDDGTLICYYSDETDPAHSQKLVYRTTKDGEKWEKAKDMVALTEYRLRPGMPVVTRMNNGQYMLAYEIVGLPGNPVYYRISDDPTDFGAVTDLGKLPRAGASTLAATPWVSALDAGTANGIIMLTGWRMATGSSDTGSDIFLSFDRGKKWTAIPNYYPYTWNSDDDTCGYSASFFLGSDGKTLYYMANPSNKGIKNTYVLYRIEIE